MRLSIHHLSLLLWCIHTSQSSPRFVGDTRVFGHRRLVDEQYLSFRGGSNQSDDFPIPEESRWTSHNDERLSPLSLLVDAKSRHCSDLVFDIRRRSTINGDQDESLDLRRLITRRSLEYLNELAESSADNSEDPSKRQPLPHPRKLLHFLAPKVPAIKHSPDVNLRIHSARSDIDSGVAACIISTLAHVFEMYSKQRIPSPRLEKSKKSSAPIDITSDRRFEQLIECVLSGVNVEKRNREALRRRITIDSEHAEDIDELLDEENLEESDGLSTRDACRAAWGIAMLGAHHMENLGGEKVIDLLQALSLRTRELLLARLKLLRQDDLLSEPALAHLTIEERINELAHELAEDAASAMWTFACVKAYTGLRSVALFETCCSILCQNPVDLRRRAQEIDDEHVAKSVGNNDIVDRLGRVNSNDDEEEEKPMRNVTSVPDVIFADKDTLLDWLSKAQINDIMWALAIHGRENTTSSIDDIRLSETAAVLGEIAFDRLIEALERDLQEAESENEDVSESSNRKKVVGTQVERDEESMTVEVVDAAALLASQARGSAHVGEEFVKKLPVESMVLRGSSFLDYPIQQVEVVDAATLLAASEGDGSMSIETEIMISSPPSEAGKEFNGASQPSKMIAIVREATKCSSGSTSGKRFFSPHDLASIAWSVTELHDPLRMQIVPMVIKLVAMLGQSGTEFLSGADLANLAWAISKYEAKASIDKAHSPDSLSLSLISWISLTALQRVTKAVGSTDESDSNVLNQFQPPELGRLLWAVSCVMSTYTLAPDPVRKDDNIYELAKLALITASMNLSLFGTEDLLRICWSFLELCGHDDSLFDPQTSISLGRILSTVEQSLYRWERGDCTTVSNAGSNPTSLAHEVPIFSSFFGRSRVNQPLLEQVVCDQDDDDDDDDNKFAPLLPKARRPLLRDLSVDPSTLCKAACAFQRLSLKHPEIKGGWKLTNVAIRLLTSKNARLLKECSVHDIIRLCEAAVRSEAESHGRELITGLFAHKVVQVLNDVLSESADSQRSTSIIIDAASPVEAATLIWALGNLGVKHSLSDESRGMAYKRLHLVTETALLTTEQVQQLDLASSAKLLRGMVLMKYSQSDPHFLLLVLQRVHNKAGKLEGIEELCSLAETLALLKEALRTADTPKEDITRTAKIKLEVNEKDKELTEDTSADNENSSQSPEFVVVLIENELVKICDELLNFISHSSRGVVKTATTSELRRLLAVYSLLPFRADDLINEIEKEIDARLSTPDSQPWITVEKRLRDAKERSESLQRKLFHETESSGLTVLKNGFMSLFGSSEDNESAEKNLSDELIEMIRASINSTIEAATSLQEMKETLDVSIDSIGQQNMEKKYFELGRCQELIANYRRIEFSTGSRRSRYDKERRKDISKRVLHRLLP